MDSNRVLFVSGIDTGVGKTYATGVLLREMREKGLRVISQKPVQTGCEGRSEDLDVHDALAPILIPSNEQSPTAAPIFISILHHLTFRLS